MGAVADGLIDVVASDHAGSHSSKKLPQWDKVFSAPNGVPGMECLVPLMLREGMMNVTAPPDLVLLRGKTVAEKGVPYGSAGDGRFIAGKPCAD